jgi:hypothetical protein
MHKTHEKISLSSWDCTPSQKLTHQAPFVITCKTTKHIKNKKIGTIESPHHQQFRHQAELRFVAFIHRKHLTLFLG